jgi:hypothetical protein
MSLLLLWNGGANVVPPPAPIQVEFGIGGGGLKKRRRRRYPVIIEPESVTEQVPVVTAAPEPVPDIAVSASAPRAIPPLPHPVVAGRRLATPQPATLPAGEPVGTSAGQVEPAAPLPWEEDDDELAVLMAVAMFS